MDEPVQLEMFPETIKPAEHEEVVIRDPLENLQRWKNQALKATWKFRYEGLFEHEHFGKPTTFLRGHSETDDTQLTFEAPAQIKSKFGQIDVGSLVRLTFLGKSGSDRYSPYAFEVVMLKAPGVFF